MNKSTFSTFAALFLSAALVGCANVRVATEGKNMVVVDNSGCFLFGGIPLFSGDPDYPNGDVCSWFTNTVKVENNIRLLEEEAERQGARGVVNLNTKPSNENIFWFIIKRKMLQTSAELVK